MLVRRGVRLRGGDGSLSTAVLDVFALSLDVRALVLGHPALRIGNRAGLNVFRGFVLAFLFLLLLLLLFGLGNSSIGSDLLLALESRDGEVLEHGRIGDGARGGLKGGDLGLVLGSKVLKKESAHSFSKQFERKVAYSIVIRRLHDKRAEGVHVGVVKVVKCLEGNR